MTNLRELFFICLFPLLSFSAGAQMPDSVKQYLDSGLYFMQAKSLYSNHVKWDAVRDSAYKNAAKATTYKEAFPALAYAFQQLKDFHGMVANSDTVYRYPSPVNFDSLLCKGIKKEFLKGNRFVTAFVNDSIAYLRMPSMNVFRQADIDNLASRLRDSLCLLLAKHAKRLILDLRMNSGGNIAPMITGISPLLADTILGYGVDRDGYFLSPAKTRNGIALDENGNELATVHNTCPLKTAMPVAVLIGPSTVSSGEIMTVYLKQQKNVKLFGERTPGYCNATEGFVFMNGEGYLLLTVNKIADAKKHVYQQMFVQPDVYVKSDDNYDNLLSDPTVSAAMMWLRSK